MDFYHSKITTHIMKRYEFLKNSIDLIVRDIYSLFSLSDNTADWVNELAKIK